MTALNPYLNFGGNAREAMEFYQSVLGGKLDVTTFGEFQMPGVSEDESAKVMHGQLVSPSGLTMMGSDLPSKMHLATESNITISLTGGAGDEAELRGYWDKLSEGARINMELEPAPWGDIFGELTDRFGTSWMVNIAGQS